MNQLVHGRFTANLKTTIGVDYGVMSFMFDKRTRVRLQLWDIGGSCWNQNAH